MIVGTLLQRIPAGVLVALVASAAEIGGGMWAGHHFTAQHYQAQIARADAERAMAAAAAASAVQAEKDRGDKAAADAAGAHEALRAALSRQAPTITREIERVVDRPMYRATCLDADGLRILRAAVAGDGSAIAASRESGSTVPGSEAP